MQRLHPFWNINTPKDGPRWERGISTMEPINNRRFINQFSPDIIKLIRQFERIKTKIWRQKVSIMFNQIFINEEMLPKYTHTHTYTQAYIYIYMPVCMCVCVCVCVCRQHFFVNKNVLRSKYLLVAKWLEALAWCLNQPGFDPSCGEILSSHTDEFW